MRGGESRGLDGGVAVYSKRNWELTFFSGKIGRQPDNQPPGLDSLDSYLN